MKKVLVILLLAVMLPAVKAQDDSTFRSKAAVDDTTAIRVSAPATTKGVATTTTQTATTATQSDGYDDEIVYSKPNVNPIKLFGSPFCDHFGELTMMAGPEGFGLGVSYAYLPEVWGGRLQASVGMKSTWLAVGPELRLSKPWSRNDWHLYGAVGAKIDKYYDEVRPTVEFGVRMARGAELGKFCLTSGSLGVMTDFNGVFLTVGCGLTVATLASCGLLLGVLDF